MSARRTTSTTSWWGGWRYRVTARGYFVEPLRSCPMKLLELDSATAHVSVDAHAGGRLSSLVVHGLELLVAERDDPLAWGSYPMIPFAGRIRRGQVAFRGTTAHLPLNAPPHAMHGYGFVSEWEQTTDNELRWVFAEPWPWAGKIITESGSSR
ncbi:MAG: hypothetical protein EX269_02910, partial [Acidimicrobiales bacterium]